MDKAPISLGGERGHGVAVEQWWKDELWKGSNSTRAYSGVGGDARGGGGGDGGGGAPDGAPTNGGARTGSVGGVRDGVSGARNDVGGSGSKSADQNDGEASFEGFRHLSPPAPTRIATSSLVGAGRAKTSRERDDNVRRGGGNGSGGNDIGGSGHAGDYTTSAVHIVRRPRASAEMISQGYDSADGGYADADEGADPVGR